MIEQLDLFADSEAEQATERRLRTPRCLFHSTARGLTARADEYAAWVAEYGSDFGNAYRCHAWTLGMCVPDKPTDRCQASVLSCNMRRPDTHSRRYATPPNCDCYRRLPDGLLYRGVCTGCDWESPSFYPDRENPAVEDAMDHAWPGWRDVPIVASLPHDRKSDDRWLAKVVPLYPAGWIEAGGPIRTARTKFGTRHHGPATPFDGYDMGVLTPDDQEATT